MTKLKQAIEDNFGGNPNHVKLVEAADKVINMWELLAAGYMETERNMEARLRAEMATNDPAEAKPFCEQCEAVKGIYRSELDRDADRAAFERLEFLVRQLRDGNVDDLPVATDDTTGVR